jgi:hypothetical protein
MQDQVIIFMALARGRSAYTTGGLTLHTITAITVVEALTDAKFKVGRDLNARPEEQLNFSKANQQFNHLHHHGGCSPQHRSILITTILLLGNPPKITPLFCFAATPVHSFVARNRGVAFLAMA